MFKLTKIISSGTNLPDPCRMYTTANTAYKLGSLLTVTSGKLTNATSTDTPLYVAGESVAPDEKKTMVCYPILPSMIFETKICANPLMVKAGSKVTLGTESGFAESVTNTTTDGVATIVDMRGAAKSGDTVYVRFI